MKPDREQNLSEEGSETEVGSKVKECDQSINTGTLANYSHQYGTKSCDVSSLTIQSLKSCNGDASPEKRILSQSSFEETFNPHKLCRYSYMDSTARSRRLSGEAPSSDRHVSESGCEEFPLLEKSCSVDSRISSDRHQISLGLDAPILENKNLAENVLSEESVNPLSKNLQVSSANKIFINNLPQSLLVHIFSNLTMQDILKHAAHVCKLWYEVSKDPDLWRHITLEDSHERLKITDSVLDRITSLSNNIISISLADCNLITDSGLSSFLCKCSNLKRLKILRCSRLTDQSYSSIADHCQRLKTLNLSGSTGLTDIGLQKIACSCAMLEYIQLNQCTKITDKSIQVLAIKCTNIRLITFQENEGVTDTSVEALASHCKSLQSLTIHKCSLSPNGFFHLSKIPTLTNIDISNNKNVSPSAVKYFVDHCKHIESLNLCLCHSIDDDCVRHIAIFAKKIKKLLLVGCQITNEALLNLGKHAGNLEHIDVGWCEEITDEGVISISNMCPKLNYLGLMRCDKVSDKTMLQLAKKNTHILYSTFLLDSQRLIAQASKKGFVFKVDGED